MIRAFLVVKFTKVTREMRIHQILKPPGTTQAFEINTPIWISFYFKLKFKLKSESDNDIFNKRRQLTILVHAELMIVIIGHEGAV